MSDNELELRIGQTDLPAFDYSVSAGSAMSTGASWELESGSAITLGVTSNNPGTGQTTATVTGATLGTTVLKATVALDDTRVLVDCIHVTVTPC
jgi:predicted ABC-type sugar transport system permease subunit